MTNRDPIQIWQRNTLKLVAHQVGKHLPRERILCRKLAHAEPNFCATEFAALSAAIGREETQLKDRLRALREVADFLDVSYDLIQASRKRKNMPRDAGDWTWPGEEPPSPSPAAV